MIYLIIYIIQALMYALWVFLVAGVPLLILWQLWKHWAHVTRRVTMLVLAVLWWVPTAVELARDAKLQTWIDALPPSPQAILEPGLVLALEGGVFDPEWGAAYFAACPENRYQRPLCKFELGPDTLFRDLGIAVGQEGQWQRHDWVAQAGCNPELRYTTQSEVYSAFFSAQGICPKAAPLKPDTTHAILRHSGGTVPWMPGTEYGQLTLSDPEGQVLTTLTAFEVERPRYPALWGVHWVPVLKGFTPQMTRTTRYGDVYDEEVRLGHPPRSLQRLTYNIGWSVEPPEDEVLRALAQQYGFDADRAVPALRSRSFFPTRFALETLCDPLFRDQMTPAAAAEIRRIVDENPRFNNNLPNRLALEAVETGCVP